MLTLGSDFFCDLDLEGELDPDQCEIKERAYSALVLVLSACARRFVFALSTSASNSPLVSFSDFFRFGCP